MIFHMDFSLILIGAIVLTGLIWAVDRLVFAKKREATAKEPILVEYAHSFFPVLLFVLVLRSFFVEPFHIPSSSMNPTLTTGDFILVNKFSYGVRLPVVGSKIINVGTPKRGDVIVFRYPSEPSIDYIKRVIGLPGDKIKYIDKTYYINDVPMHQEYKGKDIEADGEQGGMAVKRFTENLDGVSHDVFISLRDTENKEEVIVPEGHYFVSGDNRDNSQDSREWGFVPDENLKGKAVFVWMSWDSHHKDIRWSRMWSSIT